MPVPGDVSTPDGAKDVIGRAVDALGSLTGLANNVGIIGGGPTATLDLAVWDRVMQIDLNAGLTGDRHGPIDRPSSRSASLTPPGGVQKARLSRIGLSRLPPPLPPPRRSARSCPVRASPRRATGSTTTSAAVTWC